MITVRVNDLSKRYRVGKGVTGMPSMLPERLRRRGKKAPVRDIWALKNATFKVGSGTIYGIIGANGAGKTTLLKVLARISPPTSGRAVVDGIVVPLLEVGAAFQPQATGRENVYLNAAMYDISRQSVNRRMDDIVEFAGLEQFIDTPVKRYSSGMYLRLAFSVAVNMQPDILLADEVLAVGDLTFQERCLRRVEEASSEGMTVLFVSHDMAAIRRLCHRVMWINAGEIVDIGKPEDIVSRYEESAWALLAGAEATGSHVSDHGEILSTRLLGGDGSEVGAIRVSDDVLVRVTVSMKRPNTDFRIVLVFSADGVDAFRTAQPFAEQVERTGTYVATVAIPPNLLSDNVYTVKTGVWIREPDPDPRDSVIARHHALTFRVYDTELPGSARGDYEGPLHGIVRPKLDWDVARIQAPRVAQPRTRNGEALVSAVEPRD